MSEEKSYPDDSELTDYDIIIRDQIASKSELTEEEAKELSEKVKKDLAEHHR